MSMDAASSLHPSGHGPVVLSPFERIRFGREVLQVEARCLGRLADRLGQEFAEAARLLAECQAAVIVTGMGKAGNVGQKIAATLRSIGLRSYFLHPADAVHGDLGMFHADDVLLALSQSGETEEVTRLLPFIAELGVPSVAVTARASSTLGEAASVVLELGELEEACPLGLAPSTSTTAMLALGDALALVASRMRGFGREGFARLHPAGSLGRTLSRVDQYMRPLGDCRLAPDAHSVRAVFVEVGRPGRRSGAIMLTDEHGKLSGIFTDSDLARLFEARRDGELDRPIRELMTARPTTVSLSAMMPEAVQTMARRRISELPVVDQAGRPVGLLDVTDVVAIFPEVTQSQEPD